MKYGTSKFTLNPSEKTSNSRKCVFRSFEMFPNSHLFYIDRDEAPTDQWERRSPFARSESERLGLKNFRELQGHFTTKTMGEYFQTQDHYWLERIRGRTAQIDRSNALEQR